MKIKLTQVQCASMRRRVYHPLKHLLKLDTEQPRSALTEVELRHGSEVQVWRIQQG